MTAANLPTLAYREQGKGSPWVVTCDGLDVIERLARNGASIATIATQLGMPPSTFYRLATTSEEVQDALAVGKGELETQVVNIMIQQALKGDPGMLKYVHGSVLGKGQNSRESQTPAGHQPSPVTINIPGTMSDEQLEALTAQYRDVTPPDEENQPTKSSKKGIIR